MALKKLPKIVRQRIGKGARVMVMEQGKTNRRFGLAMWNYRWFEERNGTEKWGHAVALVGGKRRDKSKRNEKSLVTVGTQPSRSFLLHWVKKTMPLGKLKLG